MNQQRACYTPRLFVAVLLYCRQLPTLVTVRHFRSSCSGGSGGQRLVTVWLRDGKLASGSLSSYSQCFGNTSRRRIDEVSLVRRSLCLRPLWMFFPGVSFLSGGLCWQPLLLVTRRKKYNVGAVTTPLEGGTVYQTSQSRHNPGRWRISNVSRQCSMPSRFLSLLCPSLSLFLSLLCPSLPTSPPSPLSPLFPSLSLPSLSLSLSPSLPLRDIYMAVISIGSRRRKLFQSTSRSTSKPMDCDW